MKAKWIFWFLISMLTLLVVFFPYQDFHKTTPSHRFFSLKAWQYAYAPGNISVNPGDTITINLVSMDVVHGLYVDGYDVSVTADPGQTTSLTFVADKPGLFRMRCNVTCGAMHPFMVGKLIVGQNYLFLRSLGLLILAAISSYIFFLSNNNERKGEEK